MEKLDESPLRSPPGPDRANRSGRTLAGHERRIGTGTLGEPNPGTFGLRKSYRGAPGWFVGDGYVWSEGGRTVYRRDS